MSACDMKRCTQKLLVGHHILCYVSKFRHSERDNEVFIDKKHRENILKRPIPILFCEYILRYLTVLESLWLLTCTSFCL